MKLIIDGDFDKDLITIIHKENLPVSHIVTHVPHNPLGNGSIFLPENSPTYEEFEEYTKVIQDNNLIPIAGIDSTCQGNLEAHKEQYKASCNLIKALKELRYENVLVSSPNNIGFVKEHFPSVKIFLSYSQYVTSTNRGKILFEIGADKVILHPDIVRYFNVLKNFIKLNQNFENTREIESILPLNIGCNWGCIHWYQHHNLQSHRTTSSPVFSNQKSISGIEDEFDYPMLYCWKKRLEKPENLLKAGWISPSNIELYENLGFKTFILFTSGFSTDKIIEIIKNYAEKKLNMDLNELLNIPEPYGSTWSSNKAKNSMIQLKPKIINEFCKKFPFQAHYPMEDEMNRYCLDYVGKFHGGTIQDRNEILDYINSKMKLMEKGVMER
jgi:hypothetical protein